MAGTWLEALSAPDLGLLIAGDHFAATQTMDEESTQTATYMGAFGVDGAIIRSVRKGDADTLSFSALLLKPGQDAGMDDEERLRGLASFQVSAKRGNSGNPSDWRIYDDCVWTTLRIASTLDTVTLSADFSGKIET